MEFVPGETYMCSDLSETYPYEGETLNLTVEEPVLYVGPTIGRTAAVVMRETDGRLYFSQFYALRPMKQRRRLFIALPEFSVCSSASMYSALVHTDLKRLQDYVQQPETQICRYKQFPFRYIELETVEPQEPL